MSSEKKQKVVQGPRWTKAGTFSDFTSADKKRNIMAEDDTLQVKVRRRHAEGNYTVHYRKDPSLESKKPRGKKKEKRTKKRAQKQE